MGNYIQSTMRNRRHEESTSTTANIETSTTSITPMSREVYGQPVGPLTFSGALSTNNMATIKSSSSMLSNVRSSVAQCPGGPKFSCVTRSSGGYSSSLEKKTTISSGSSATSGPSEECELDKLRVELREAKRQVYEREQQLLKLHREIHKLRSVLDHSEALNVLKPSLSMTMLLASDSNNDKGGLLSAQQPNKKQGVSSESYGSMTSLGSDPMQSISFVWKDFDCRRIIQEALMENSFLKNYLNQEQLDLIVDSMYEKEFNKGHYICRRGAYGCHLYVITYGQCEIIDAHDKPVNQIGPGKAFGELALLYNCTRTASVKSKFMPLVIVIFQLILSLCYQTALTRVRTWVLDRKVFQLIMMKTGLDRAQAIRQFLKKCVSKRGYAEYATHQRLIKCAKIN